MSIAEPVTMTIEEFLALPEDGVDRELIRGELREGQVTCRNRYHSKTLMRAGKVLTTWADQTGMWEVFGGEAGFILSREPRTVVGIDIAIVSAEFISGQTDESSVLQGAPTLAIEILSPSDTMEHIHERTELLLENGVPVVWWLDPQDRTMRIYRLNQVPLLLNETQELSGDPELPGLKVAVKDLFD